MLFVCDGCLLIVVVIVLFVCDGLLRMGLPVTTLDATAAKISKFNMSSLSNAQKVQRLRSTVAVC